MITHVNEETWGNRGERREDNYMTVFSYCVKKRGWNEDIKLNALETKHKIRKGPKSSQRTLSL